MHIWVNFEICLAAHEGGGQLKIVLYVGWSGNKDLLYLYFQNKDCNCLVI